MGGQATPAAVQPVAAPATAAQPFGGAVQTPAISNPATVPAANPFGAPAATPAGSTNVLDAPATSSSSKTGLFGQVLEAQRDDSLYTPESELTPEELAAFRADHFQLGKIPERPPPQSLCV